MNVKRILCPVDFSANSEAVLACASSIAKLAGAELHMVHAYEEPSAIVVGGLVAYAPATDAEQGRKQLQQIVPTSPEVKFRHAWIPGQPATVLLQYAAEHAIELIVMGTHGFTGLNRVLLGSVAEAVVRRAECPVLTIRRAIQVHESPAAGEESPVHRAWPTNVKQILCPIDFSGPSQVALGLASSLARESGAKLHLVHVDEPSASLAPGLYETLPTPLANEDQRLFATRPTVEQVEFTHQPLLGDPAHEIIAYVKAQGIDLVVIGSHGRTGLSRLLMGSVAEQIVRKSPVPVWTIKSSRDAV